VAGAARFPFLCQEQGKTEIDLVAGNKAEKRSPMKRSGIISQSVFIWEKEDESIESKR